MAPIYDGNNTGDMSWTFGDMSGNPSFVQHVRAMLDCGGPLDSPCWIAAGATKRVTASGGEFVTGSYSMRETA